MKILFITHADLAIHPYGDGSTRYRCFNVAEVAHAYGCTATVMSMDQLKTDDLNSYDLISWLRPVASKKFMHLINRAKQLGIRCIADVDDLIFDPALASSSPSVVNALSTESSIRKRFANHAVALDCFDAITVSTRPLQEHVTRLFENMPVYTLHNGLSAYWLSWADKCKPSVPSCNTIAYLPGTRSHDRDFQSICHAISRWMHSCPTAMLRVIGKISADASILPTKRFSSHPWMDYFELPSAVVNCTATLAPLENTTFNLAKTHVKFIESAALGVPLIASPIPDLVQHKVSGLRFAETEQQWFHALKDASYRSTNSNSYNELKNYALSYCTAEVYTNSLIVAWMNGRTIPAAIEESHRTAA